MNHTGFTLVETLVSIAIVLILFAVGMTVFISEKNATGLSAATDGVYSALEQARSDALTGKDGMNHAVRFATTSYISFEGSAYSASDPSNVATTLSSDYTLTSTLPGSAPTVIFSRLTGVPNATGTVTVTKQSSAKTEVITISSQGGLTLQK